MQNLETGEMVPLEENNKAAADKILPGHKQGAAFKVGQEIVINGARFRIHSIGRKGLVLHGLPGTKFEKAK